MLEGWAVLEERNTHRSADTQTHTQTDNIHKYAGNQVMQGGSPRAELDS